MKHCIEAKLLPVAVATLLMLAALPAFAAGDCSPYMGQATINEVFKENTNQSNSSTDFVEIKILDTTVPSAIFEQWSIQLWEHRDNGKKNDNDGFSGTISLSTFNDKIVPWLVLKGVDVGKYFNFKTGFEIVLLDENSDVIDYLSVDGQSDLRTASMTNCPVSSLPYDWDTGAPGASDKFIFRIPDGTGNWDSAASAAANPTEDSTNDVNPPFPFLTFQDLTITQGTTTAAVVLTLDSPATDITDIIFRTIDGSLVGGSDYTSVDTTGAFAVGDTSLTFNIPVNPATNLGNFYFFVILDPLSVGLASIADHVGEVTVIGQSVDHFAISHDGAGINCQAEAVTITAHNSSHNLVSSYSGTITLSTSTSNGDWTLNTGNGTLTPGAADSGAATYTFAALDGGQIVLDFRNTHAETVSINLADGVITESSGSALASEDEDIVFRPYGFSVTPNPIGTQVAGKDFDFQITAVGNPPTTAGCTVITEYTGNQSLEFWSSYDDPNTNTFGTQISLDTVSISPTFISTTEATATALSIDFTNGVSETITANYFDAGSMQIHMLDDVNIGEPAAGSGSEVVVGGGVFVVRPFGFAIDFSGQRAADYLDDGLLNDSTGTNASYASDPNGSVFASAGTPFTATLTSVAWQLVDDGNNDGIPDAGANLTDNTTTRNFGGEATAIIPADVSMSYSIILPNINPGTLSNTANGATFAAGVGSKTLSWDEVGVIGDLTATLSNYLSGGENVTGQAPNVGRFIPASFQITPENGMLLNSCVPLAGTPFTYIGQSFGYDALRPGFVVSAMNALPTPTITQNYTGLWAKLSDASVTLTAPTEDASQVGSDTATLMAITYTPDTNLYNITDNANGTLTFEFGDDEFVYDKDGNSEISEFLSDIDLTITAVVDLDGVSTTAAFTLTPDPVRLRFGRINMSNVFGSELIGLQMPMVVEYFTGGFYQANIDDSCTDFDIADIIVVADNLSVPGSSTITLTNPTFVAGELGISLSAPGTGITGQIDLSGLLNGGVVDNQWLQYDWNGDGDFNNDPTASATFGIFSGNDVNIYIQQIFQ